MNHIPRIYWIMGFTLLISGTLVHYYAPNITEIIIIIMKYVINKLLFEIKDKGVFVLTLSIIGCVMHFVFKRIYFDIFEPQEPENMQHQNGQPRGVIFETDDEENDGEVIMHG
ncbi:uncharacterized protein [Linepithema humile]|uniref:uncharacterized protein n=1 Tax=Linepithema humile TaxID=83485 RepID=UPI00062387CC|nr:PREDICTED: uncharacterized protein LOC105668845 [Linepithema humile]